ncbi:MAG: MerR family transcriptional regulator [Firmicutes bacterium]|nr:MerR family transcriptional regulator [Bacillota bacterium]MCL5038889.1 MerR family transcriptional regulator [Bacillota bacterium]
MAERHSYQEAIDILGVAPYTFRQLLDDYCDLVFSEEERASGELTAEQLETLKKIIQLRGEGKAKDKIREFLSESRTDEPQEGKESFLVEKMEQLARELRRSEDRRVEDRDKLLTALMRTQQEIQHLRYELSRQTSRKERKKKGLFSRLFGP